MDVTRDAGRDVIGQDTNDCTNGDIVCQNGARQECRDGSFVQLEECEFGCDGVSCAAASCTDGDAYCEGTVAFRCDSGVLRDESCSYMCEEGECIEEPLCPADPFCEGDVRVYCDENNNQQRQECPGACEAGACAPTDYDVSNLGSGQFTGTADLVQDFDGFYDTSSCPESSLETIDGNVYCVSRVNSYTLTEGSDLEIYGDNPFIIVAADFINIAGTITLSQFNDNPAPGGFARQQGPGAGGMGGNSTSGDSRGESGGGGGAGGLTRGADSGETVPADLTGEGGAADRNGGYAGEPLLGGSGGGNAGGRGGAGGHGGGAIQLSARNTVFITESGVILATGSGGLRGAQSTISAGAGGGGGGGAGGTVLIEATRVRVAGLVSVAGGGGGGGAEVNMLGNHGEDGPAIGVALGGAPLANYGTGGGNGGGGSSLPTAGGAHPSGEDTSNTGGGGGSGGVVIVRSTDSTLSATFNPEDSVVPLALR